MNNNESSMSINNFESKTNILNKENIECSYFKKEKKNIHNDKKKYFLSISLFFFLVIIYKIKKLHKIHKNNDFNIANTIQSKYDINFKYEDYENNIITNRIEKYAGWQMNREEANFINGIIRKNKIKKCLEIGVANGGSSIVILNAIKDIDNSFLVSLDLNEYMFMNPTKKTGFRVNKYFPELTQKWKLFTGDQPHKFLVKLNITFDFLFLDTAHITPGEIINFIEALPFLNDNSIIVLHDIKWHFTRRSKTKFYPAPILLMSSIFGDKVLLGSNTQFNNIGAVFLYSHQENHYLDYFLLLFNFWEYMPNEIQIDDLRIFIKSYYKKKVYLNLFNEAVSYNQKSLNIFNHEYISSNDFYKIMINLGKNNSVLINNKRKKNIINHRRKNLI